MAEQFHVHLTQVTDWKQQLLINVVLPAFGIDVRVARAADVDGSSKPPTEALDLKTLHAKIGQLTLEKYFLEGALIKAGLLSAKR